MRHPAIPLILSFSRAISPWRDCHSENRIRLRMRLGEGTVLQAQANSPPLAGEGLGEGLHISRITFSGYHISAFESLKDFDDSSN